MARIAVVGAGAIGGAIAALLEATSRHEITLCSRRPLHGLKVETPQGVISVQAANVTDPSLAEAVDWVLVATKAYDAKGAAAWFPALCGSGAPVAVLQNGVEHRERFAGFLEPSRILPVVIDFPVERRDDGSMLQRGPAQMRVEAGQSGRDFAGLFAGTDAIVEVSADFLTAAWRKLCLNTAGAIPALLLKPSGVLQDEALGNLALEMVAECVAVGRAEGARLDDGIPQSVLDNFRAQPPDSINSLLADRMAGRPMEIDARNGAIVRKGERHGIRTPVNRMTVALLQALGRT